MTKKILFIITKSNFGGAQRYVYDLATNLPRNIFTVSVALGGTGERDAKTGTLQEKLETKNIPTLLVTHFMRDMSLAQDIKAFFELCTIIRRERPDVLHVTSSKAGGLGALAGWFVGVQKIIFTSHGLAYDEAWRPRLQRILIAVASWVTFLLVTKTIQLTQDTYTRASHLPFLSTKMVLVHNGIETPKIVTKETARGYLCKGETVCSEQWIGTIAELTKNKNLHVLIETLSLIHKEGIRPHLWILGEGEERGALEKLTEKLSLKHFVHLPGYVQNASHYLTAFDIFTLPSRKEGLPYVLLEAGYASLPTVVSAIPGVTDIITNEETGILVQAKPDELAKAFIRLLKNEVQRKRFGEALNAHVKKSFSIEKMIQDTTRIYLS